jgi:hypothetical protein
MPKSNRLLRVNVRSTPGVLSAQYRPQLETCQLPGYYVLVLGKPLGTRKGVTVVTGGKLGCLNILGVRSTEQRKTPNLPFVDTGATGTRSPS